MMPIDCAPDDLDLTRFVRRGDRVVIGQACGEPQTLVEALVTQRASLGGISAFMGTAFSTTLAPEYADHISFRSMGAIGTVSRLSRANVLDIIPCHVGQIGALIERGVIGCDVLFVQVSPPDQLGRHSFGLVNDHVQAAAAAARVVIAEVNDQVPFTYCDGYLNAERMHVRVATSRAPVTVGASQIGESDRAIARNVSQYIQDGATLQMGIGAAPEAITRLLSDRRDLGVHSGMIGDGIAHLMQAGVVTNARKAYEPGVTITGALIGSADLYKFAHENAAIGLRRAEITHGTSVLAQISNLVTINSAIEVDLTGQVNAEQAGDAYLGGTGGQVDFVRAGARSPGGRAIIALPATAKGGATSRIVASLSGPVTTARAEADVIVTEFGAAELAGQGLRERARRLIAIAHPDFQETLSRDAHELFKRGY
jgi:acyl-CoA hydrolase